MVLLDLKIFLLRKLGEMPSPSDPLPLAILPNAWLDLKVAQEGASIPAIPGFGSLPILNVVKALSKCHSLSAIATTNIFDIRLC